jgi:hypothetical protein
MRSRRLVAMTILSAQHQSTFNMLFILRPNKDMLSVYLPGLKSPLNDTSGSDYRRVMACVYPAVNRLVILFNKSNANMSSEMETIMAFIGNTKTSLGLSIGRQYENRDLPAKIASSQVLSRVRPSIR